MPVEEYIIATLAHELGHYYRSHQINDYKNNFFYQQEETGKKGVPSPIKDSALVIKSFIFSIKEV